MEKKTEIISALSPDAIPKAIEILKSGGLIVFPTDTLYGLAANAFNPTAIQSIYKAKERTLEKAIPILIGDITHLCHITEQEDPRISKLMEIFWPGALTLVMHKKSGLPDELSQTETLGIRMPAHAFALRLLKASGPLAVTSANRSGAKNPINALEVMQQLNGRVDLIIDNGVINEGKASTVVDCTCDNLICLRKGPIPFSDIQHVWENS